MTSDSSEIVGEWVEQLPIQKKTPIFSNPQGLRVVMDGKTEYRYFEDFYTGEIRELLIDDGTEKCLQIKKFPTGDEPFISEMELLNCLAMEKTLSEAKRFILHSSFIDTEYGAVLFTAPSGIGKSTQADLWKMHRGTDIINGDRAGIWKSGDQWMAGGIPWCGTSGIMQNKSRKLAAIVILRQGPENQMVEMSILSKIARIMEQLTLNPWNEAMVAAGRTFCMELCQEVPVISLSCRPDVGAVEVLEKELRRLV